jgi:hypothetical protein
VLVWMCTRASLTTLIFLATARSYSLAKIAIPSNEEIALYKEAVGAIYPLLSDVWSTMDGLKLYLQQSGNTEIQARYYNGWTHGHYVTSIFVFCPDGTIPIAFFNVPGSVHNSQVAPWGRAYDKLGAVYEQ